eukprot:3403192-Rhodomonas_salina.1
MFSWAELSTGPTGEGGLDWITGTLPSTADKGWGATHIGLVSRWQRSQGRRSCSQSHDSASGELGGRKLTGGEERRRWMGLHGLTATGPNRS